MKRGFFETVLQVKSSLQPRGWEVGLNALGGTAPDRATHPSPMSSIARRSPDASNSEMESALVARLVGTPSARAAVLNPVGIGNSPVLSNVADDPRVRDHFGNRRIFLSCSDISALHIFWSRLAAELGLKMSNTDIDVIMVAVLDERMAYKSTLIVIDRLETIYAQENNEQQKATDVLLAVLAAVDEVALLVSFCGLSLPESVHWTTVGDHLDTELAVVSHVLAFIF